MADQAVPAQAGSVESAQRAVQEAQRAYDAAHDALQRGIADPLGAQVKAGLDPGSALGRLREAERRAREALERARAQLQAAKEAEAAKAAAMPPTGATELTLEPPELGWIPPSPPEKAASATQSSGPVLAPPSPASAFTGPGKPPNAPPPPPPSLRDGGQAYMKWLLEQKAAREAAGASPDAGAGASTTEEEDTNLREVIAGATAAANAGANISGERPSKTGGPATTGQKITSKVIDFIPLFSTAKNLNVVVDGVDPITNEKVSGGDRVWAGVLCIPFLGAIICYGAKAVGTGGKALIGAIPGAGKATDAVGSATVAVGKGIGSGLAWGGRTTARGIAWVVRPLRVVTDPIVRWWGRFTRNGRWFYQPKLRQQTPEWFEATGRGDALGVTNSAGDIVVRVGSETTFKDFFITLFHERGHQWLTPTFIVIPPLHRARVWLMRMGYSHSHILRGLEELLVDARAQLMLNGVAGLTDTYSLVTGGYKLRLSRVVTEAHLVQVVIGGVVYYFSAEDEPAGPPHSPAAALGSAFTGYHRRPRPARTAMVATTSVAVVAGTLAGVMALRPTSTEGSRTVEPVTATETAAASQPPDLPPQTPPTPFAPMVVQVPAAVAADLDVAAVPGSATTNPSSVSNVPLLKSAYEESGLVLHQGGGVVRRGIDPRNEPGWPPGVTGLINWGVDYFRGPAGALAVKRAYEANVRELGYRPVALSVQGVADLSVFERTPPERMVTTQIWYWTADNLFMAVAASGKFGPDHLQADQVKLFQALRGLPQREPAAGAGEQLSKEAAGQAYLAAAAPVNAAEPEFFAGIQVWSASMTPAEAQQQARPLLEAFNGVESALPGIASKFPAAEREIEDALAAAEVMKADLARLAFLNTVGVDAWINQYRADRDRLIAASNAARSALGLAATRS